VDSSELEYIKRWEEYLATYPLSQGIKNLESSLASLTADKITGRQKHNLEMWDKVSQLIVAKIIELKQKRGEPK
jgi:hypothetical protein